jgi:hypothetical protein
MAHPDRGHPVPAIASQIAGFRFNLTHHPTFATGFVRAQHHVTVSFERCAPSPHNAKFKNGTSQLSVSTATFTHTKKARLAFANRAPIARVSIFGFRL